MTATHHAILSPTWIWVWFYDQNKGKHLKELFGDEAEAFINGLKG